MAGHNSITLLHLSDLQFCRNHRFGRLALPSPDDHLDKLLVRLTDDLTHLREQHHLTPDLLIITGDIAETGKPSEFADAFQFLERLAAFLGLPRHRLVVVPGNHDINRSLCDSYFTQEEGHERAPRPPYWPKWTHYTTFFQQLYADHEQFTFTPDEPWTLFQIDDLKVAVAGLNSTMAESHLDATHYGHCSETQYRWFAQRLQPFQDDGWLRIGAIHHNVRRGCQNDEENLRDADDFARLLGASLNVCLHGHTHEASTAWLDQHVPILSTGSAAVVPTARADEVPNQYQILQLAPNHLKRWSRAFDPRAKRWIGDPRASDLGDAWVTESDVIFLDVSATFPDSDKNADLGTYNDRRESLISITEHDRPPDDFLSRVEEICHHRSAGASVTAVRNYDSHLHYLRVSEPTANFVRQYPVGVFEHGLTSDELDRFLNSIDAPYRASDSGLISQIVYGGNELPPPNVTAEAQRRRVRLSSFVEYQGIIDFRSYVQKQTERLQRDEIYPPHLYVPQRMRFAVGNHESNADDALAKVQEWIASPDPRFVVILGDFGNGKTFLLHELARRLGTNGTGLTPVLIDLRALEKARTLDTLIAQHLAGAGVERIDLAAFRYMLQQGRVVLLFDGFDELALRVSYDRAAEHFETILQSAVGDSKVILTSRTQHFESEKQVRTVLYDRTQPVPGLRYCKLLPFAESQIKQFLVNRWQDVSEANEWLELLHDVKDLLGLSENPRMLGFITELNKGELRKAKAKEGIISAAELYRLLLERWLIFEYERAHHPGVAETLSREARWAAVTAIANRLWQKTEKYLTQAELIEETTAALRPLMPNPPDMGIAAHLIGSGSLLRRDDEGSFFLVHQSVLEWLVARQAATEVALTGSSAALGGGEMSQLMTDFFFDLSGRQTAVSWASTAVASESTGVLKGNALAVLNRVGVEAVLNLANQDLRGRNLAGLQLRGADLRGANLTEQRLANQDLTNARLDGAKLVRADLTNANLVNASLIQADLTEARLMGADLSGARLDQSLWRRAKLVGAKTGARIWKRLVTSGAAMPNSARAEPFFSSASSCLGVTWSADSSLLASGHEDGLVRLWDWRSAAEIRAFVGHARAVTSLLFSPDGELLITASDDKTVRLWTVASGQELFQFAHVAPVNGIALSGDGSRLATAADDNTVRIWDMQTRRIARNISGHSAPVRCVAFSPDGRWLASGGADYSARVWSVSGGMQPRMLGGHVGDVMALAFSPNGATLATCSADGSASLWDWQKALELRRMATHSGPVNSIAFATDGKSVATCGDDNTVRVWDTVTGSESRAISAHSSPVRSVSFSPDSKLLASCSEDMTVRLWDTAGREVRKLYSHHDVVRGVSFSIDGRSLMSAAADGSARLWDVATGHQVRQYKGHDDYLSCVAISPGGDSFASGSADKTVRLWEIPTGKELHQLVGHQAAVLSVAYSSDGSQLVTSSYDRSACLWDVSSGRQLRRFSGHQASVWSVAFDPNGSSVATGSGDRTVRFWNSATARELERLGIFNDYVRSVAFSPKGDVVAIGSDDTKISLWDISSEPYCVRVLEGHSSWVWSLAFSSDGQALASGSADGTARLWDVTTSRMIREFKGHRDSVLSVSLSTDGELLATGSADNTAKVWDLKTGKAKLTLLHFDEGWAAYTPDGRYKHGGNVAGGFWFAVNLCRFEPGELDLFMPAIEVLALEEPFL